MSLLIAGGSLDPNLDCLIQSCRRLGVEFVDVRHSPENSPGVIWDLATGELIVDGKTVCVEGGFLRHDVFADLNEPKVDYARRALAWSQTLQGWLLSQSQVQLLNRHASPISGSKGATLVLAQQLGLPIPQTVVTNLEPTIRDFAAQGAVTKPVAGGDYCYGLNDSIEEIEFRNGASANPAFVQMRLIQPEVRIYVIGDFTFAFEMASQSLDYRQNQDADVSLLADVPGDATLLRQLMVDLKMDFGAADFKTNPATGDLTFLEINNSPMFAKFDAVSEGTLSEAIVKVLIGNSEN